MKIQKECKDGKVRNPATGRCVKNLPNPKPKTEKQALANKNKEKALANKNKEKALKNLLNKPMINSENYSKAVKWALTPWKDGLTEKNKLSGMPAKKRLEIANKLEKAHGNSIIGQKNNNQWTTKLGEHLVIEFLKKQGKNPKRPETKNGYSPDIEADDGIYEVKTRNWTTQGTAGEKVYGTMYKYSDIPVLYGKPLYIVCVAYQEWELVHGNTKIFSDEISTTKKKYLQLARSSNVYYLKFSDMIKKSKKLKVQ